MDKKLKTQCDLLVNNRAEIGKISHFELPDLQLIGSAIFTFKNLELNLAKIRQANEILKQHAGPFSTYRDNLRLLICCKMATSKDPEKYLEGVQTVYDLFQAEKVFGSDFRLFASIIIYDALAEKSQNLAQDAQKYVDKTYEIFNNLKSNHPLLTSDFSTPFAAMLAVSGKNVEKQLEKLESCYEQCRATLGSKSTSQTLSQALILADGDPAKNCEKVLNLWNELKSAGFKLGKGPQTAVLAATALVDVDEAAFIKDAVEIDNYLKHQKGFRLFGVSPDIRRTFSLILALNHQAQKASPAQQLALNSALALAIELELILVLTVVIASSTTAAISSH